MKHAGAFYQLVYHFTWSTKKRLPFITPEVEARLYPYIGYKCHELGYRLHAANGMEDHTHVLLSLTPSDLVADVAKNLKGAHHITSTKKVDWTAPFIGKMVTVSLHFVNLKYEGSKIHHESKEHHREGTFSDFLERMSDNNLLRRFSYRSRRIHPMAT